MKGISLLAIGIVALLMLSCSKQEVFPVDGAGVAAGKYFGAYHTADRIYNDQTVFIHRHENSTIEISFLDTATVFPVFYIDVQRSGPAIHQPFGSEADGTFILDLAATPDNIRFALPNGTFFEGIRLNNFHE